MGIPADLFTMFAPNVPLDEVFIPLRFFPKRNLRDYPLTEDEAADYRQRLQKGLLSEDMQRALLGKEREWEEILRRGDKLDIAGFWGELNRREPAAVLQGYPGMGKSTLVARLTLHFARLGLGLDDPTMGEPLATSDAVPVPVLLLIREYAVELQKAETRSQELSVLDYLRLDAERKGLPGLFALLRRRLSEGRCLVILDGLDEVSDIEQRRQVKKAIKGFVSNFRRGAGAAFNRFVITSRVAGYDVMEFEAYSHFTLAELTKEQIDNFLPRWCRASACCSARPGATPQSIERSALEMERSLQTAIATQPGVRKLAEIPLLFTLLAVMRQNKIELPRQRIDLYKLVTKTLLEDRNIAKDLQPIPEAQAIERLGPIAFAMQERDNSFAQQWEVKAKLTEIVSRQGGTAADIQREVESFLARIRERGGLFVIRTGDYFGFFHRTFQEYFVARYLLNQVSLDPGVWIPRIVQYARKQGDTWREPFLLAVAYQSGENFVVARRIIAQLLEAQPETTPYEIRPSDLALAAACVVEAKPASIGAELEGQIARHLLRMYEQAQRRADFEVCNVIEKVIRDWLLSLPAESYRPALLVALTEAVSGAVALQRAALTMLTMIAQQLVECPQPVFDTLIPPLLGLAGLPAIGNYHSIEPPAVPDYTVADLALSALSFMDRRGPAGLTLAEVRRSFIEQPEHLRLLAHYSLESGTLLTLTVVPLAEENYRRYEQAIGGWLALRDRLSGQHINQKDIDDCLHIHRQLLDCAQEAAYPASLHLLAMLHLSSASPARPWQAIWQDYLLLQLKSGKYIDYQEAALLYISLFPEERAQNQLALYIQEDFRSGKAPLKPYAQRFLATLAGDMRDMRDMRDMLITQEHAMIARKRLAVVSIDESIDLLAILLGRVLQLQEAEEKPADVALELEEIVQAVLARYQTARQDDMVMQAALDVLRYLPARAESEVRFLLQCAEQGRDEQVVMACATALQYADTKQAGVKKALSEGRRSSHRAVRDMVAQLLRK